MSIILDNENSLVISYYEDNDISSAITFQLLYGGESLFFDNEDAEVKTIQQNGQEITLLIKEEERQLFGTIPQTSYRFLIAGNLTEKEILDIASSIQSEKEE